MSFMFSFLLAPLDHMMSYYDCGFAECPSNLGQQPFYRTVVLALVVEISERVDDVEIGGIGPDGILPVCVSLRVTLQSKAWDDFPRRKRLPQEHNFQVPFQEFSIPGREPYRLGEILPTFFHAIFLRFEIENRDLQRP
jgi:hypothetical protein